MGSDCLLGQFERTLWISDSQAGLKVEKSGGVVEGEGECGDDVVWLLSRDRRSLDILKGHIPPIFGPCLLWPNGRPSQLLVSTCLYVYVFWYRTD